MFSISVLLAWHIYIIWIKKHAFNFYLQIDKHGSKQSYFSTNLTRSFKQEMSFKKTNGVGLQKGEK